MTVSQTKKAPASDPTTNIKSLTAPRMFDTAMSDNGDDRPLRDYFNPPLLVCGLNYWIGTADQSSVATAEDLGRAFDFPREGNWNARIGTIAPGASYRPENGPPPGGPGISSCLWVATIDLGPDRQGVPPSGDHLPRATLCGGYDVL